MLLALSPESSDTLDEQSKFKKIATMFLPNVAFVGSRANLVWLSSSLHSRSCGALNVVELRMIRFSFVLFRPKSGKRSCL